MSELKIFTLNDDFAGYVSLFCESADVIGKDGEKFVRFEDHIASHVFNEQNERAAFEKHYVSLNDGFCPSFFEGEYDWNDAQNCWLTWKARAKYTESGASE